jgi:hypothetical protein
MKRLFMMVSRFSLASLLLFVAQCHGLQQQQPKQQQQNPSRRETLGWIIGGGAGLAAGVTPAWGAQDSMNVDNFLRTGLDAGGPMGVSSQAGKSRPQTGVYLR